MNFIRSLGVILAVSGLGLAGAAPAENIITLDGAGATFPYPIYSKWFDEYHKIHPEIQINYQSIGSGGGIRQIMAGTVDFGASDGPMTDEQLSKARGKIYHIPTVLGADVLVFNVSGVSTLRFTGETIAGIFLGKITNWNDPAIIKINPNIKLPDAPITVVHRADGSGTTYCFTDYLSKISKQWETEVGYATSVSWPVGLGGKGNDGVAGLVKQTPNSIGYVELIYAVQNHIDYGLVQNKAGHFSKASLDSVSAAAMDAAKNMPKDYRVSITNAQGEHSYPISTFTWLLVFEKNPSPKGRILREFLSWMLDQGQAMSKNLSYAPLPENVKAMVKNTVRSIRDDND